MEEKLNKHKELPREFRAKLSKPMPMGAIDSPNNQGLTPIKAAYVMERLNDVFGVCGWRLVHKVWDVRPNTRTRKNYETGKLETYEVDHVVVEGYIEIPSLDARTMTYYGGSDLDGKARTPADGMKSAVTDCLSKCASTLEIGIQVYKGQPWDQEFNDDVVTANTTRVVDYKAVNEPINILPVTSPATTKDAFKGHSTQELKAMKLDELKFILAGYGNDVDLIEKPTKTKLIKAIELVEKKMLNDSEESLEVIKEDKKVESNVDEIGKKYIEDKATILRMSDKIISDLEDGGKRGREESFVIWNELESLGIFKKECEERLKLLNLPHKTKEELCNKGTKEDILKLLEGA